MTTKNLSNNSRTIKNCNLENCSRSAQKRGYCWTHYKKLLNSGEIPRILFQNGEESFLARIEKGENEDDCWKWKGGVNFNQGYFLPTYEVIYLIAKKDFKLAQGANVIGDVWDIPQEKNNPHPAPFPVELVQRCIGSTDAEVILDPFFGSGSTAIAAEALKRDWIGIEISPDYCELANQRIKEARGLFTIIY